MSVPASQRSHSKLEVILMARHLAAYTIKITKNQNVFLPDYNNGITNDIISIAKSIYVDCWTANNIYVTYREDWLERKKLQENAARNCNNLLALIQLAQEVFHLKTKRIKYWGQKTIDVRNKIRAWSSSDSKRYSLVPFSPKE